MTIKPCTWKEYEAKKSEQKVEDIPEPMMVPIKKFNTYNIETVGEIISNTRLGFYRYPRFASHPLYLGIAFIEAYNQYAIILTSNNKGDWEAENTADLVEDKRALELIIKQGKEERLDEPEFKRLKELRDKGM